MFPSLATIKTMLISSLEKDPPIIFLRYMQRTLSPPFFLGNLYLGLSFGFLHLRRPNKLLSCIHKAAILLFNQALRQTLVLAEGLCLCRRRPH